MAGSPWLLARPRQWAGWRAFRHSPPFPTENWEETQRPELCRGKRGWLHTKPARDNERHPQASGPEGAREGLEGAPRTEVPFDGRENGDLEKRTYLR